MAFRHSVNPCSVGPSHTRNQLCSSPVPQPTFVSELNEAKYVVAMRTKPPVGSPEEDDTVTNTVAMTDVNGQRCEPPTLLDTSICHVTTSLGPRCVDRCEVVVGVLPPLILNSL